MPGHFDAMRIVARNLFHHALSEGSVLKAFQRNISCERGVLRICEDLYDLNSYSRVIVISIGKAAHSMVEALLAQAGDRFEGIIVGPLTSAAKGGVGDGTSIAANHCATQKQEQGQELKQNLEQSSVLQELGGTSPQIRGFRYFAGGHPLPNAESLLAGRAILKSLGSLDSSALVIFMLSGGGSSMVEVPVDDEISLADLAKTYSVLVHCGAPIGQINAIRKHLSATKGGRLAVAACPAQQVSVLVSDVPDDKPDALASGPTMPDATSVDDCYAIAAAYDLVELFPPSVRELFVRRALDETPKSGDPEFGRARWWTISSNATLLEDVRGEADRLGFHAEVDSSCDDWEYLRARDYLLGRLNDLRQRFEKVCLISGGEVTVKVSNGGMGGRNQQFALACASDLAGKSVTILSAGTDGIDGNSPAAGAIVDGSTLERSKDYDLDPQNYLNGFNAYTFFDRMGDAIVTGPTGNNLRDLRILLAY